MAQDVRPYKSKEQDGQGNEIILRDQQLVEQDTATTMPAGTYFQTLDVDGRPVKIPNDNMLNLIVEGLGIIFNGQSDQQTVTKVPTLNGNNFGASTVATLASVLGDVSSIKSSNFDNYTTPGTYYAHGYVVEVLQGESRIIQRITDSLLGQLKITIVAVRLYNPATQTWGNFKRLDLID